MQHVHTLPSFALRLWSIYAAAVAGIYVTPQIAVARYEYERLTLFVQWLVFAAAVWLVGQVVRWHVRVRAEEGAGEGGGEGGGEGAPRHGRSDR